MTLRFAVVCLVCWLSAWVGAAVPFDAIRGRIVEDMAHAERANVGEAEGLAAAMTAEGAWADIDYADRHRTRWAPAAHLRRLRTIAAAFGAPGSPRYRDAALREALLRGLGCWQAKHPRCDNWWYNQIFAPQRLGEILLLAQEGGIAPEALPGGMIARWRAEGGDPTRKSGITTGSNLVNIAAHCCYRAILTRDEPALRVATERLFAPLAFTEAEGLQRDLSYHQHGPQLYLGNYGYDWLELNAAWLARLRGTELSPPPERAALAPAYALGAYFPAIRGQWYLFNAVGRQQASEPGRAKATKNLPILRWLTAIDPAHAADYAAIRARLRAEPDAPAPAPLSKVFPRSDYALHVRPDFTFDVRTASLRTNRCEWGNDENILGHWLAEGATGFVAAGDEYADIAPLWDWWRVPGVTVAARRADAAIPRGRAWGQRGKDAFVLGVDDGADALVFARRREDASAPGCFAWFALGDAVVCLGAGLGSADPEAPLCTTLDQPWARGPLVADGKPVADAPGAGTLPMPVTLTHAAFRYTLPGQAATLRWRIARREGNWTRVSPAFDVPVRGDVLTLWLDHGAAAQDAAYAYVVSPKRLPPPEIAILANTPALQAVADGAGRAAFVFYAPGRFTHAGREIVAERPGVFLIGRDGRLRARRADAP